MAELQTYIFHQKSERQAAWDQIHRGEARDLKVCTMTYGARLSHSVNLPAVRGLDFQHSRLSLRRTNSGSKDADQPYVQFSNQVTLLHPRQEQGKNCSILLFGNGKVTVAGCKSEEDLEQVATSLCQALQPVAPGIRVLDINLHMLNAHLKLDINLALFRLNELLMQQPDVRSCFEPANYHAVVAKLRLDDSGKATFCLFQSGSVLMTVKSHAHLAMAHAFITQLLRKHADSIII